MKLKAIISNLRITKDQGAALLLAVIAMIVMAVIGGSFAMLVQNEARSIAKGTAYDQSMYVAESGVEDVLYQRSKNQSDMGFPYTDDSGLSGANGLRNGTMCTDARSETNLDGTPNPKYNPNCDAIAGGGMDDFPCWPYNEKLYANVLVFGPDYECNDGSSSSCNNGNTFKPLASWPANSAGSDVGWKDMDPGKPVPLPSVAQSSGQRYTTGLFTVCNDDFFGPSGAQTALAAAHGGCLAPPCDRRVVRLSIVSVGDVQTKPGETVERAVKVDILPAALYSGVIDKYVDLTLMYPPSIYGPIHINGWWDPAQGANVAFLLFSSATLAALPSIPGFSHLPEMVSVSFPEPAGGDWQPLFGTINYVHLPIRIDIPSVNWNQFEDRMNQLYDDATALYNAGQTHLLKREDYDPGNMYNFNGAGGVDYVCQGSFVWQADAGYQGGASPSINCREAEAILRLRCSGPWNDPRCCAYNGGDPASGINRIHNCNSDQPQVWNNVAFDLFDNNAGGPVRGAEPSYIPNSSGNGPREKSLRHVPLKIFDLHFSGGGCGFLNPFACLTSMVNRPEFAFMGKHEFQGKVFIDGAMGVGTRTPYHTCGEGDGTLSFYCVVVPAIDVFGLFTIPSWHFGFPHWHLGNAKIKGEMLVNGRMWLADSIQIDGGAVYADESIIKNENSGMDFFLNLKDLLCGILQMLTGFPTLVCDIIFGLLDPIIKAILPWWPEIDLSAGLGISPNAYFDIDGWNQANVINSGTIYTRGDFIIDTPDFDLVTFAIQQVLGMIIPGLTMRPAVDPIRIWNYGAIVAGGRKIGAGAYSGGNVYIGQDKRMDILIGDPNDWDPAKATNTGYVFARASLRSGGDIITHYGMGGFIDNCHAMNLGMDPNTDDCRAKGIFYSGGATAGASELDMFSTTGLSVDINKDITRTCTAFDEPSFWGDALGNISCWASHAPLVCGIWPGGDCNQHELNIRGYVFAGAVGAMPNTTFRLYQDSSVLNSAVQRRYFRSLSGAPIDWMEIEPPGGITKLQ